MEEAKVKNRHGFAIASFILGILSYPFLFIVIIVVSSGEVGNVALGALALFIIVIGIVGTVLGALSLKSEQGKKLAVSGFILSIIPLVVLIFAIVIANIIE